MMTTELRPAPAATRRRRARRWGRCSRRCPYRYCTVLYCTVLYCAVLYCAVHTGGGARHQDGQVQPGEGELQCQRLILQVEVKIKSE